MAPEPEHVTIPSRDALPISAILMRRQAPTGDRHRSSQPLHSAGAVDARCQAPGVVLLHGYGSRKEHHLDFAALLAESGITALVPDLRGHGATPGAMDEGMIGDVLACVDHLGACGAGPIGLRGSSMGGFLALVAAPLHPTVQAVVAICPARPEPLAERMAGDWPLNHPLESVAWRDDGIARGFWHATGDEVVPWSNTLMLHSRAAQAKHLRIEMGGGHQTLQHDPRIQAQTAAFLATHLTPVPGT